MENNSKNLGIEGEKTAREYLISCGYTILEINWRFKKYELDIICQIDQTIVFVEVKTRNSELFGSPEVFVTGQKQKFLISAGNQYLIQNSIDLESRFDIISIVQISNSFTVKHLQGAFYPAIK